MTTPTRRPISTPMDRQAKNVENAGTRPRPEIQQKVYILGGI